MYVIGSEERFVEISSPNECDKILKIPNEQTEPTDYMANCSTDTDSVWDNEITANNIVTVFIKYLLNFEENK